ncbi:hypothetical protein ACJX0J_034894, partial [Zea mays]
GASGQALQNLNLMMGLGGKEPDIRIHSTMVVLCGQLGSDKIISLYTSCARNPITVIFAIFHSKEKYNNNTMCFYFRRCMCFFEHQSQGTWIKILAIHGVQKQ